MNSQTIDIGNLTPELQHRLTFFEADKAVYVDLQNKLAEVTQETQRLLQKAAELEGQASRTDASWKRLAATGDIDQAKVNEEIERAEKLRKEAKTMRATVEARTELENNLILRAAKARMAIVKEPGAINKDFWQGQLERILARDGLRDELLNAFILSRALCLRDLETNEVLLSSCNGQRERKAKTDELIWRYFRKELESIFDGGEVDARPPALATIPAALAKEAVVNSPSALHKLQFQNAKS